MNQTLEQQLSGLRDLTNQARNHVLTGAPGARGKYNRVATGLRQAKAAVDGGETLTGTGLGHVRYIHGEASSIRTQTNDGPILAAASEVVAAAAQLM